MPENNLGILSPIPAGLIKNEKECINALYEVGIIPADKSNAPHIVYAAVATHPNGTTYFAALPHKYPSDIPHTTLAKEAPDALAKAFPDTDFASSLFSIELIYEPCLSKWSVPPGTFAKPDQSTETNH